MLPPSAAPSDCDYCGLPVAGGTAGDGPRYCCLGCRFAAGITAARGDDGEARWMMARLGLALFFTMNVMVFTMVLWSAPEADPAGSAAAARVFYDLARHACLLFSAPVVLLLGGPLLAEAADEVRRGRGGVGLLLMLGVGAALAISVRATWAGEGHVYFEVACTVLVAVTLGRWLEASGKLRTTEALRSLRSLLPDTVRRVDGAGETRVALASVALGDMLRVLPGEHVPTDARIVTGRAAIDERAVTGESEPVEKGQGDGLWSGSLDLDGELLVEVVAPPGAGTLERLIDAVTDAARRGSRRQRLAGTIAAWFLPLVVVVALGSLAFHWHRRGPAAGVLAGLAVVVVACPCALGLATPLVLWAAIGRAARRQILIRDGDALFRLARARTFCFDKTGTLTTGSRVEGVERAAAAARHGLADDAALVSLAAGLATGSTHVHARAVVDEARRRGCVPVALAEVRTFPGRGVEGRRGADAAPVRLGSGTWTGDAPADGPCAVSTLCVAGTVVGRLRFAETVRPEAAATAAALAARGARLVVLSGDRRGRVDEVAAALGMAGEARLLPEEKLARIEALRGDGGVVMIGDGINDAPALAAADVGVALGCGADVSRWSAAVCLLRDDLSDLPWLVDLAARSERTVRWNLLWAFAYNAALVPLAAAGQVHPALAAAAMLASSVLVVAGSLRLADDGGAAVEEAR